MKLENKYNFISNFFVLMHFKGQKKKSNNVIHAVSFIWPLAPILGVWTNLGCFANIQGKVYFVGVGGTNSPESRKVLDISA